MRTEALRLVLLPCILAAGCTMAPDLAPRIDSLSPTGGPADRAAAVTIHGKGFFPRASQVASGGPASIDTTHRAWLDGVELAQVTWVDEGTLETTIPAGLALGPHKLTVENARGYRGSLSGAWTVIQPAVLAITAHLSRTKASTGQPVTLNLTVSNDGGADVHGVALAVNSQGPGGVTVGALPSAVDVPSGGEVALSVSLTAASVGDVALGVTAFGTEAYSGRALSATAATGTLTVQARAALHLALAIPAKIPAGGSFPVTMLVLNDGDAAALGVVPSALALVSGSSASLASLTGPTPAAAGVPGHGSATFTWAARLLSSGTVQLEGGAAGTDANDGGPAVALAAISNLGNQQDEVVSVSTDPLGDGTPAAALASYGGRLWVGPTTVGGGFWVLDPSTGQGVVRGVQVAVDKGSSPADNHAWLASPPATTFGTPGCAKNTTACGPSNEDGRGVLSAGTFSGTEWLLYGGSSQHKARYVYLASTQAVPTPFQSVDLGTLLPTTADSPTAAAFTGSGRLYLAFTDTVAKKSPFLVALSLAPTSPWLDAVDGIDAVELGAASMPGLGGDASSGASTDPQPRLDAVAQLRGFLYLASGGGVMRSAVVSPRSYATNPGDWKVATPAGWAGRTSIVASSSVGLTPADRAVPALAAFGACGAGPCLFLARNVRGTSPAVVPQLWQCDPTRAGEADACDAADWSLAVPDASGDDQLTQLGVATHGAVSVLLATSRYLYLGYDDAITGAQLYRSAVVPEFLSDFKGENGCAAGTASCEGLGGAGFGDPSLTRFLDARAVTAGAGTTVYVAAGDGVGPLRLFAVPE